MTPDHLRHLLESLKQGEISTDDVLDRLKSLSFEDVGFAKIDHHRRMRNGYPEVIYGEGKTPEQVAEIFGRLAGHNPNVLCTRASAAVAEAVRDRVPEARYHGLCRVVELRRDTVAPVGLVALAAAGTSDLPVAEEAAVALEVFGSRVERVYDVGVAGIHRLFAHGDVLRQANCVVAVAGMEGALPSVIGGLVDVPVIAVPTSVGYGTSFGGITALLAMLNSCASGISVVNIDNGFGAAYQADMINKLALRGRRQEGER
ncbi:MAG: nickel pincer cofactor biosynthesis protein LarB [Deferrisomatales bacterium]|nr:nickel pincer cofactor biosynthesis protein LarB [Deferrisomatales bacterium]